MEAHCQVHKLFCCHRHGCPRVSKLLFPVQNETPGYTADEYWLVLYQTIQTVCNEVRILAQGSAGLLCDYLKRNRSVMG